MQDDDTAEFRRAMKNVRPLRVRQGVVRPSRPVGAAKPARAVRGDVLRESPAPPAGAATVGVGDAAAFRRAGLADDAWRRLRRGQIAIEAEIDLHGLTRHAAHAALLEFLRDCVRRDLGCVRVIHGKGLRSGPGGPVLKHVAEHWLQRVENVLAYVAARPADGGGGAVLVLLGPVAAQAPAHGRAATGKSAGAMSRERGRRS